MNDDDTTMLSRIATWWRNRCRHDWHPLPTTSFDAGHIAGYRPSTPHICTRCGRIRHRRTGAHDTGE